MSISNVFCGQLAPRVPTEVGCEALFSASGHANDARRTRMDIRLYKRLITGKHQMHRIYVSTENVKRRYMEKFKDNSWNEDDECDSNEYLQQEQDIWKIEYPLTAARMFKEEKDDEEYSSKEEESEQSCEEDMDLGSGSESGDNVSRSSNDSNTNEQRSDDSTNLSNLASNMNGHGVEQV